MHKNIYNVLTFLSLILTTPIESCLSNVDSSYDYASNEKIITNNQSDALTYRIEEALKDIVTELNRFSLKYSVIYAEKFEAIQQKLDLIGSQWNNWVFRYNQRYALSLAQLYTIENSLLTILEIMQVSYPNYGYLFDYPIEMIYNAAYNITQVLDYSLLEYTPFTSAYVVQQFKEIEHGFDLLDL